MLCVLELVLDIANKIILSEKFTGIKSQVHLLSSKTNCEVYLRHLMDPSHPR